MEKLFVKGTFNSKRLLSNKPAISLVINETNIPLKWIFYKNGENPNDADLTNMFGIQSMVNGAMTNKNIAMLNDFDASEFNVTISCDPDMFYVKFNDVWERSIPYNRTEQDINAVEYVQFTGEYKIDWAGYGGEVSV